MVTDILALPHRDILLPEGVELAYLDHGAGRPLVFVHGLASNYSVWQRNIATLSAHYRCLALDLPGYGQSSNEDFPVSIEFFAKCVASFIRELALEEVVLVGHSMGGQISIHLVVEDMVPVSKLILTAPAGFEVFTPLEQRWFRNVMKPALFRAMAKDQIRENIERNFYQFPDEATFMLEERLELMEDRLAYEYYCELIPRSALAMIESPVFDRLPEIAVPTLILYGTEDELIPNRLLHPSLTTEAIALAGHGRIPDSRLIMVSEAGHFLQFEQPGIYHEAVRKFVGLEPAQADAVTFLEGLFKDLFQKHYPALHNRYLPSARLSSTLWGELSGEDFQHYLEILLDATSNDQAPEVNLERLEEGKWAVSWNWAGMDPLTGKSVDIPIRSVFTFLDGRIYRQEDQFSMYRWIAQTRGINGRLWGWIPWWQERVKNRAISYIANFG